MIAALLILVPCYAGNMGCGPGDPVTDGGVCPDGLPADIWGECAPDGGDGDADGDSDGDVGTVTLTVTTWTLGIDGERELSGVTAELWSSPRSCEATPCEFEGVSSGEHELQLFRSGWVQEPIFLIVSSDGIHLAEGQNSAFSSIVRIEGLTVSVRMEMDPSGIWMDAERERQMEVSVRPPRHQYMCPNSALIAGNFDFPTVLCIEGERVSLCSSRATECYVEGDPTAEGYIDDSGRLQYTVCNINDPEACDEFILHQVD